MPLNYRNPELLEVRKPLSVFGIISFAALLFTAPCAIGGFFFAWSQQGAIDALSEPWSTIVVWAPAMIPVLIAFGFGAKKGGEKGVTTHFKKVKSHF